MKDKRERPDKDLYYLEIARQVATRGTCLRRNFGAVIVNEDQIVSTGYAGAPRKMTDCLELGSCLRNELGIPAGKNYEMCRSVHAEMNALIHASRREMLGGTLYLVGISAEDGGLVPNAEPCKMCKRMIINSGIETVIVLTGPNELRRFDVATDWLANEQEVFETHAHGY